MVSGSPCVFAESRLDHRRFPGSSEAQPGRTSPPGKGSGGFQTPNPTLYNERERESAKLFKSASGATGLSDYTQDFRPDRGDAWRRSDETTDHDCPGESGGKAERQQQNPRPEKGGQDATAICSQSQTEADLVNPLRNDDGKNRKPYRSEGHCHQSESGQGKGTRRKDSARKCIIESRVRPAWWRTDRDEFAGRRLQWVHPKWLSGGH